jgi:GDP-mannose 6-dehydrogenase
MPSNHLQIQKGFDMITAYGRKRIGILGFAFKAGTDDLRESPLVQVIELLIGKGYEMRLYDRNVSMAALTGANRDYILNHIPHVSKLMVDQMADVLAFAEVIVVGNGAPEFSTILEQIKPNQVVVDLVRVVPNKSEAGRYDGICW